MGELRRAVVVACWVVMVAGGSAPRDPRPRTIRGFKNVALSTARGFGKRSLETPIETLPADWFAEEMSNNPELARLVVHKFIDLDDDGMLTSAELLRPIGYQQSETYE